MNNNDDDDEEEEEDEEGEEQKEKENVNHVINGDDTTRLTLSEIEKTVLTNDDLLNVYYLTSPPPSPKNSPSIESISSIINDENGEKERKESITEYFDELDDYHVINKTTTTTTITSEKTTTITTNTTTDATADTSLNNSNNSFECIDINSIKTQQDELKSIVKVTDGSLVDSKKFSIFGDDESSKEEVNEIEIVKPSSESFNLNEEENLIEKQLQRHEHCKSIENDDEVIKDIVDTIVTMIEADIRSNDDTEAVNSNQLNGSSYDGDVEEDDEDVDDNEDDAESDSNDNGNDDSDIDVLHNRKIIENEPVAAVVTTLPSVVENGNSEDDDADVDDDENKLDNSSLNEETKPFFTSKLTNSQLSEELLSEIGVK